MAFHFMTKASSKIPTISAIDFIKTNAILYLEAGSRCTIFYLENTLLKIEASPLKTYEKTRAKTLFLRIHHKFISSLEKGVKRSAPEGRYIELSTRTCCTVSVRKQEEVSAYLQLLS